VIGRVLAIGTSGFRQLWRTRVYLNLLVAGIALTIASLAFNELGGGEGARMLIDLGLAFIALLTSALAGVVAIVSVTREIETKQVHLFLARPIARGELVVGRYLTVVFLIALAATVLSLLLTAITAVVAPELAARTLAAGLFSMFEAMLVAAIAIVFGVGSSSTMSAVFTTTVFVLGRLTLALRELLDAGKLESARGLFEGVYLVLPHFFAFDLTQWANGGEAPLLLSLAQSAAYGLLYAAALLAFAIWRLNRREIL
jgi:ABC-type transport system involved in multi-copper enzyme maturation permease subunit